MDTLFGPVPSKRLGRSLGIDPVRSKICNYDCVYCQLGRTKRRTLLRRAYVRTERIAGELREWLARNSEHAFDWITLVGAGEPCLNSEIGAIIASIRARTSRPIAVITNGSLLASPCVRKELLGADAVLPSLDAGTEDIFRRVNRPHPHIRYKEVINGLEAFRQDFEGNLWVEVMLLKDVNDSDAGLDALATQLRRIQPDEVHLNVPTRPPAESWVKPAEVDRLVVAASRLGDRARVLPFEIGVLGLSQYETLAEALRAILPRHPMSTTQLVLSLYPRWSEKDVRSTLAELASRKEIQHQAWCDSEYWVPGTG